MTEIFLSYLGVSVSVSLIVIILTFLYPFISIKYAAKWKYFMWIFLAILLIIPINLLEERIFSSVNNSTGIYSGYSAPETAERPPAVRGFGGIVVEIPAQAAEPISSNIKEMNTGLSILNILVAVWLVGGVVYLFVHISSYLHYRRGVMRDGEEVKSGTAFELAQGLMRELNINTNVAMMKYGLASSPLMTGFIRPVIIISETNYSENDLYFILRHELIHYKRRDVWLRLLFVIANSVHWFNPVIHLMRHIAAMDMELSCDEEVVKGTDIYEKRAYTEMILSALKGQSTRGNTLTTQLYVGKKAMKKRFENIMCQTTKKNGAVILACAMLFTVILGSMVGCAVKSDAMIIDDEINSLVERYLQFEQNAFACPQISFDSNPDKAIEIESIPYFPANGKMSTLAEWEELLYGLFTYDVAEYWIENNLNTTGVYYNIDGKIYVSPADGPSHSSDYTTDVKYNGENAELIITRPWLDDDEGRFEVTVLYLEKSSDGWRTFDYQRYDTDRNGVPNDESRAWFLSGRHSRVNYSMVQ